MSQQEDDLRALAKIMDFLRAVSIILVVMNVYWFCYGTHTALGCGHRRGGQDPAELRPHGGLFRHPLHGNYLQIQSRATFPNGTSPN